MRGNLVSPVLVGREVELAALMSALDTAVAGEPAVVLVGGEAGVGKTRLVEEGAARAREAGARVLAGSCIELGGEGLPFSPLADALRSLVRVTPPEQLDAFIGPARFELARLLPELDPESASSPPRDGGQARLLELVLGVIQRLAADRPLMFAIEDLHWADRSTLDLVALFVRALRGVRVLVVVSFRSDELHRGHPLRPLITGWERVRSVQRLELERFGFDEVAGQLEAILGTPPTRRMVELVYERSEGNAFLVEEILGAVQSGADPDQLPVSLRDVLLARAEQLSSPTLGLLRTAAAAGRSVPDQLLAAVAGLDEETLDAALREAVEHHLLAVDETGHGYVFRHALTRDAIYSDTMPRERVRIHAAYAKALSADPALAGADAAAAAALALHYSAAHDLPRALVSCVEAARLAAAYAPAEAQRHLERALELWPGVPDAAERCGIDIVEALRRAGVSAYAAGALDRSVALFDEALAEADTAGDPERLAVVLEARATALLDLGREDEATAVLERAASLLPAEPPTVARAVVLASLASHRLLANDFPACIAAAERAVVAARAAGAREQEANARIILGAARSYVGDSEDGIAELRAGLALAETLEDHALTLRGHLNLSDGLEMLGRHAEAAEVAGRGLELAARVGLARHVYGGYLTYNRAESLLTLGRWAEADRLLADAPDSGQSGVVAGGMLQLRASIAALCGRYDDAAAAASEAARGMTGSEAEQFAHPLTLVSAEVARGRGDLGAAREHVRRALEPDPLDSHGRYRWPFVWLGLRIEAESGAPEPERVAALTEVAGTLPTTTPAACAYRALAGAEGERAAGARAGWESAVEACREHPTPYLLAYALLRQAEAACAAGEREAAAPALEEAARLAAELGAAPLRGEARTLARRARLRLGEEDEPGVGGFDLTEREREVLELVAEGRSNRQIAEALFISPKTASVHVSNILGKLGVASRGEAAAFAHSHGLRAAGTPSSS